MEDIAKEVGKKIRMYRKQLNMTIEELADIICKSKSTIAKYEAGTVSLDIYTLEDIADAFHINAYQLLLFPKEKRNEELTDIMKRPFQDCEEFFIYYYDGRRKEVVKSYLRILNDEEPDAQSVFYYLAFQDYENYSDCEYIYKGSVQSHDFFTYFFLTNMVNPVDKTTICVMNPLHQNSETWGILSGILDDPLTPFSTKILLSKNLIADSALSRETFIFSPEEIRQIRKTNLVYPHRLR